MDNFKENVEKLQFLTKDIEEIRTFILNKEKFEALDALNRDLCIAQLKVMEGYQAIFSIRLGLNAPATQEEQTEKDSE